MTPVCESHDGLVAQIFELSKAIAETRSLLVRAIVASTGATISALTAVIGLLG